MDVENRHEKHLHLCLVNFVKPMSLVMDDHLSQTHQCSSAKRVSTKNKAPSPPGLKNLDSLDFSQWYPGNAHFTMDHKEKLVDKDLSLVVVLPDGVEKMTTVHGSKPLMDLLVTLCARYRLNPSSYTLELITAGCHNIKLKPSALIGTLDAEKIILKPKGDDKNRKTGPQKPEVTVRMVINYKKTQKTILRVNPQVPLTKLLPAIAQKCEFAEETTILLKDVHSLAPLDLSCSLNDYTIREVYARDTRGHTNLPASPSSPTDAVMPGKDKNQKEKENKGLFSKFRKSKKTSEQATAASAPASPVLVSKPRPLSMALPSSCSPPLMSPTSPVSDVPKKRRAPQPPILVSQRCHSDISTRQRLYSEPAIPVDCEVSGLSRGSSAESSLKRTKRKAPPPPTSPSGAVPETVPPRENAQDLLGAKTLEEIMEETSAATREDPSVSSMSDKGPGEDQSCDRSSEGNQLESTKNNSAIQTDVCVPHGPDSSQPEESVLSQVENELCQSMCEDPASKNVKDNQGGVSSDLQQDADRSRAASILENTTDPQRESVSSESCEIIGTSRPTGEDAQVQTDFTPLPELPHQQEHTEQGVPSAKEAALESAEIRKKDISTSTDELQPADLKCIQASKMSTPIVGQKAPSNGPSHPEPKPKPSDELTREYIPKLGMTTYTIVPPKSNDKMRYFEVALTLETPPVPTKVTGEHSNTPREDILSSMTTSERNTANGCLAEATNASSPSTSPQDDHRFCYSQAGSPGEVKATKVPPATKPKPGSFRLSKHKKTPGYYVTSAVEKSPTVSPSSGHMEDQVDQAMLSPPPPAPPATDVHTSPKRDDTGVMRMTKQSSLLAKEPSLGLSLEKLRSFAAPRPYSPSTPSRFAQAVSSAVKRSHSLPHSPKSPSSVVTPFPAANRYSVTEQSTVWKLKVDEKIEVLNDKDSLPGVEQQPSSSSELVQIDGKKESPIAVPYDEI
ncbi:cordon-bleu protein-like 1b isoform X2 [Syngnathoides biaculeatus]|uniref:cordon-bleu protein-like 1b isoform X2 n=1 Tax=Syngnathoides biaculeatus TaxID=300417 RepID=UPI002ADE4463|nr:cordon-bleu protein-like 1b isoform X2 [Syngnathoides biaculeatus]